MEQALADEVQAALNTLSSREARILRLYFGLNGDETMTLEQIGNELNVTKERVRQIRDKALGALKHPSRIKKIRCLPHGELTCHSGRSPSIEKEAASLTSPTTLQKRKSMRSRDPRTTVDRSQYAFAISARPSECFPQRMHLPASSARSNGMHRIDARVSS